MKNTKRKEEKEKEKEKEREKDRDLVTRGYNIVADGWAGAYKPISLSPTPAHNHSTSNYNKCLFSDCLN